MNDHRKRVIFKFLNFYLIFLLYSSAQAQVDYIFDPLSITASRLDDGFVSETRDIIVLDRQQIAAVPGESVSEVLQYLGSVDIRRRGINGIQADYGLRGCSFEQVLVLIDGVRVNDPQTGHHNNDLPVSLSEIEKIEILMGHGSSLYGSNGIGGVIHVITQSPEKTRTRLKLNGGSFKTISGEISQSFNFIGFKNRIHLEKQKSDGYMRNMNYDVTTLSCQVQKKFKNVNIRGRWGSIEKAFGANRFYADYPSYEETKTRQAYLRWQYQPNTVFFMQGTLYGKIHEDFFVLDIQQPEWYQNNHQTDLYGTEIQANLKLGDKINMAAGCEIAYTGIQSSVLENRNHERYSLFGEMIYRISDQWLFNSGCRLDYQSDWENIGTPSVGVRYALAPWLKWRFSAGRAFRAPNFTELYYLSPANQGDPDLKPETGWTVESGFNCKHSAVHGSLTFFWREENNRIEWVKPLSGDFWQVVNLNHTRIQGASITVQRRLLTGFIVRGDYTFLSHKFFRDEDFLMKYAYSVPTHQFVASLQLTWTHWLSQNSLVRLIDKKNEDIFAILDMKWNIIVQENRFYLTLSNLLNMGYEEIPGVPMPGRNVMAGMALIFDW